MVYFDNAATGGFKPRTVFDAAENVMHYLSANPGRSGHRLSVTGGKIVYDCRKEVAEFFDAAPERVIFTKNCTEALNLAIFGLVKDGGTVITTVFEHNSVLRPLTYLRQTGKINLLIASPSNGKSLLEDIESKITPSVCLVVMTAVNNVTGRLLPVEDVGKLCKAKNIPFLVDGAQAGGHIPLSLKSDNISALCLAGHKGLYGIMGSGVLVIDENTDVLPRNFGGTGTESLNLSQPNDYPERLESGTLALPAIAALGEGVRYAKSNLKHFSAILEDYTARILTEMAKMENITVYSSPNPAGIVAFSAKNVPSQEFADVLNEYDIAVRGGFQCAPLTHKFLNTDENGLVRASLAPQNSSRELRYFLQAVKEISSR